MKIQWLFFIRYIVLITAADQNYKLLFVQILFRHGDRAPIDLYPTDPNSVADWTDGLGNLTLQGKRQHYGLGKYFRSLYKNFKTSDPLEVHVTSAETQRCIESATVNLAAFYALDEYLLNSYVEQQPLSIHYIPEEKDKYLETETPCPSAEAELQRIYDSPEAQEFIARHQDMYKNLSFYSGTPVTNWTSANYLHDTLSTEKAHNLTIPKWVDPYYGELTEVTDLSFFWDFSSPVLHRLRAGPLIQIITERMNQKINGIIPDLKFQIYSSHDTNVAAILNALNLFNFRQPPFCASLLFELYDGPASKNYVRLLFLNSTEPEKGSQIPHILVLDGCSEFCPLDYFINYTHNLIPMNWEQECQLSNPL